MISTHEHAGSELRLEITHDARTRKIRPGSDLRHDVRYIHNIIYVQHKAMDCLFFTQPLFVHVP